MTEKSEMLALADRIAQQTEGFSRQYNGGATLLMKVTDADLIVSALRAAAEPVEIEFSVSTESRTAAASAEPVAWRDAAVKWLRAEAEIMTNSLHCGDSSVTIQTTHGRAAGLLAVANYINERAQNCPAPVPASEEPVAPPKNLPDRWEYQENTSSVICGGCLFRFGAEHPDSDGKWTCPNCGDGGHE